MHRLQLASSVRYKIGLPKKEWGAATWRVSGRGGSRGEGGVRGSVGTERASVSRLCIMAAVQRTCERDAGVRGNQGRVFCRGLCGGIDRACVSLHAYVTVGLHGEGESRLLSQFLLRAHQSGWKCRREHTCHCHYGKPTRPSFFVACCERLVVKQAGKPLSLDTNPQR